LINPTIVPAASIARITSGAVPIAWNTHAPTTVASAKFDPTERSMPRVRITSCCPIATMAMTAV
jgi:hypothetical protein